MRGIEQAAPIVVDGTEYSGPYLAILVRMNPNLIGPESAETPQIIAEVGRIVARAKRAKDSAETAYRIWRDGTVHRLTNDLDTAIAAGFECACAPGTDSRGKAKPPKTPAASAAEAYVRTLPDYARHQETIAEREEAWATLHAVYEAAQARTWAARSVGDERQSVGDDDNRPRRLTAADPPKPHRFLAKGDNSSARDFSGGERMKKPEARPPVRLPPPPPPRRK